VWRCIYGAGLDVSGLSSVTNVGVSSSLRQNTNTRRTEQIGGSWWFLGGVPGCFISTRVNEPNFATAFIPNLRMYLLHLIG
jgi:hypothetical protein